MSVVTHIIYTHIHIHIHMHLYTRIHARHVPLHVLILQHVNIIYLSHNLTSSIKKMDQNLKNYVRTYIKSKIKQNIYKFTAHMCGVGVGWVGLGEGWVR